jgi:hypothetical protein
MIETFPISEAQVINEKFLPGNKRVLLALKNGNMLVGNFEGIVYDNVSLEAGEKVKIPIKYKFRINDASHPDYKQTIEVSAGLIDIDETELID